MSGSTNGCKAVSAPPFLLSTHDAICSLGPLVKQVRLDHILEIVDRLSKFASQQDDEVLRGITSMGKFCVFAVVCMLCILTKNCIQGLKTVITEVDPAMGPKVCARVIPNLLSVAENVRTIP